MQQVRIGIIGIGNMGSGHLKNLQEGKVPEMAVGAVCDVKPERLQFVKETYGDIPCFESAEELMNSGLVDAVFIAVPHYSHPPLAMMAMKKGLHVMCEKPAGVYTKQVKEMNAVAKTCNVKFGMMFNQRTNCVYRKMHELVHSGKYGEIRRTNWIITDWYRTQSYYDSGEWRATWAGEGGGVLLNQCPHQLDLWQWICGMPEKILAKMQFGHWHDIEVEDDVTCFATYKNGATGVFVTSTGDAPGTNRFEITLDKAKLVCENGELTLYENDVPCSVHIKTEKHGFKKPELTETKVETDGENLQHIGVLRAFAAAILRNEPMVADGSEGMNGLTISNAMHLSAFLNREVTLPIDDDLYYSELQKRVASSRRKTGVVEQVANTEGTY